MSEEKYDAKEYWDKVLETVKAYSKALYDSYAITLDRKYEKYTDRVHYQFITKLVCGSIVGTASIIVLGVLINTLLKGALQ